MPRSADEMRDIASTGGKARAATMSAEDRAKMTRAGAAAINGPVGLAKRIVRAWPGLTAEQRAEVDEILAGRRPDRSDDTEENRCLSPSRT